MLSLLKAFIADERGMETVEYGIVGTLIGVGTLLAFTALGDAVAGRIDRLADLVECILRGVGGGDGVGRCE